MINQVDSKSCRDTWVEVSLEAIARNSLQFKRRIGPSTKLMAVVKADGYGHGAVEAAAVLLQSGADYLAVAFLDEALQLRHAGITAPILVLGCTPITSIRQAVMNNIAITIFNPEAVDIAIAQASDLRRTAILHLKVDTGMSRLGVQSREEALWLAKRATGNPYVKLEGVFTHFAKADEEEESYTWEQFRRFRSVTDYLEENGIPVDLKHCCNSAGAMRFPQMHLDMVRVGIALYGLYPSDYVKRRCGIQLEQAMSLKTRVSSLSPLPASNPVSKDCCSYRSYQGGCIAALPIGYGAGDGVSRWLSKVETVAIRGLKVPIAGRIGWDQATVNVSAVTECEVGDEVVLIGGGLTPLNLNIEDIAKRMSTINYEVVCSIGSRVPRIYH